MIDTLSTSSPRATNQTGQRWRPSERLRGERGEETHTDERIGESEHPDRGDERQVVTLLLYRRDEGVVTLTDTATETEPLLLTVRSQPRWLAFVAFLLLAVVASACSSGSGSASFTPSEGVPEILQFSAPLLSGGTIEGATLAGKDVALWLWAPWWIPCQESAPDVAQVARAYEDQIEFIGVPGQDSREAMAAFVEKHQLTFPQAVTEDGSLWTQFGVAFHPAWVLIDESGLSSVIAGEPSRSDLEHALDELISDEESVGV
jgi:thiol-disulfide isomerase/thioredoxin